ncbi:GDNF family receptor alpha-3 isoform X2 [Bombina bombina]|uniref:GDNF family receptor alpha-3 isoform X2 n=1 Tax=Bombina bombina TaxID=8345 RepID=UPI00235A4F36|nr:GDNF family receptor alpha-3 isoform X2 [Bombina bombina]
MKSLGIYLFFALPVVFLSAESPMTSDCLQAEQLCFNDPQCNSSYHILEQCSQEAAVGQVARPECLALQHTTLMHCKCRYNMKKEDHCLRIYWAVHPVLDTGSLELYKSPYEEILLNFTESEDYLRLSALISESDSGNACVKEGMICSSDKKCNRYKTQYVSHCSEKTADRCDQRKCHRHLRNFFEKVPQEFTKRLLFCPCHDSYCADRRRKTIVPECSFEENPKQNCLQVYDSCIKDTICRSRLADFQKHCPPFDKTLDGCPAIQHSLCLQSYLRMIGTVMTPNYISNDNMDVSLSCSCEGSANNEERCKNIIGMFNKNRCLKSSMLSVIPELSNTHGTFVPVMSSSKVFKEHFNVSAIHDSDLSAEKSKSHLAAARVPNAETAKSSSATSGVSCPSLALTLLCPTLLLWIFKTANCM